MVKYKKIRLYPTAFYLHVFMYAETVMQLENALKKAMSKDDWSVYCSTIEDNEVCYVESVSTESEGRTILMVIQKPNYNAIVHEIVHVLNHLSKYTSVEIGIDSQEWNAYFQDYLFEEISPMIKKR